MSNGVEVGFFCGQQDTCPRGMRGGMKNSRGDSPEELA